VFQDYCATNNFASGGFIADSQVSGDLNRPGQLAGAGLGRHPGERGSGQPGPDLRRVLPDRRRRDDAHVGDVSLLDNASHSIIDDVWAWRTYHGSDPVDVGWTENKGDTGLVVTGSDVTAYGLAVEHYQKSEVIWAGQGGTDVFFQNELPYDVPSQAAWNESATFSGYPAFQVGAGVKTFQGYGMGSYVVFIDTTATLHVTEAFQVPQAGGAAFRDVFGLWIGGSGGLDSIINGTGGTATDTTDASHAPVDVVSYP
jgi:hypothetical protein